MCLCLCVSVCVFMCKCICVCRFIRSRTCSLSFTVFKDLYTFVFLSAWRVEQTDRILTNCRNPISHNFRLSRCVRVVSCLPFLLLFFFLTWENPDLQDFSHSCDSFCPFLQVFVVVLGFSLS